ncbi:hypothetical protein Tco_0196212, partial [Tanacetum coccineum]
EEEYGPVDHELVFKAMSKALEVTNLAYLDLTDKTRIVYVMNLRDSRAVVALAQHVENEEAGSSQTGDGGTAIEGVANESTDVMRDVKFLIKM